MKRGKKVASNLRPYRIKATGLIFERISSYTKKRQANKIVNYRASIGPVV